MALVADNLRRMAGGAVGMFHYYAVADAIAAVTASGYFNAVTNRLRRGDVIIVIGANYTTIDTIFVNSVNDAAVVTTIATEGVTVS